MEITIDFTKSAQENADVYYKKSKKHAQKRAGAEQAIKKLEKRLKGAAAPTKSVKRDVIETVKKEWYEKFHWFFTSKRMLVIGGKDAQQNDLLNSKHFEEMDLFFHANIFGASVMILKGGADADKESKEEAAQFAACYSSAWKEGLTVVDVYSVRRNQVSKSTGKGAIAAGSFLLKGEREWYRNMALSLVFFKKESRLNAVPEICLYRLKERGEAPDEYVIVRHGREKKSDAARKILDALDLSDMDALMQQLPSGTFSIRKYGE